MRSLELKIRAIGVDADTAFERISRFDSYPNLVEEVRAVTVHGEVRGKIRSDWEVYFRNGPLKWSEVDYFQRSARRIVFQQISGDFDVFRGSWSVENVPGGGCEVRFETTFDFGIPSMAGVLEPIATRVLKEGISIIVCRLLGNATVIDDPQVAAAVAVRFESGNEGRALTA